MKTLIWMILLAMLHLMNFWDFYVLVWLFSLGLLES